MLEITQNRVLDILYFVWCSDTLWDQTIHPVKTMLKLININQCYRQLEKLAGLRPANFLAPAVGRWPSATWRALRALFSFRCLGGPLPIILFRVGYPHTKFQNDPVIFY